MRVLHTSDWHIGKRLCGFERLQEQKEVLAEIAAICDREKVDLILVAGDIFDTFLPSAEAEDLFYDSIKKIAGADRCVLLISGNHDDNIRLSAATALSESQGIYIYGNNDHIPVPNKERRVHLEEADNTYAVVSDGKERVFVNILPFPNEARLREDRNPEESFSDKMRRWIGRGESKNIRKLPSIFMSHLFVCGGKTSEGEREIDLGGARAITLDLLPLCSYTALGHLHRKQHFTGNVYYSGSILQYSFDEAGMDKSVVVFDLNGENATDIREIKLKSGKQLVRLAATSVSDAVALLKMYPEALIELTLYLTEPLLASQIRTLKDTNKGLVSIITDVQTNLSSREFNSRKAMSSSEIFKEYYNSLFAVKPSDELTELFLSLTEEEDETQTP